MSENFTDNEGRSPDKPLARYYFDALSSDTTHRRVTSHHIAMGGSAYSHLSESKNVFSTISSLKEVFNEFSNKFIDFVDILSELNKSQGQSSINLL